MHLRIALLLFLLLAHRAAAGVVPFYVGTFTDHTASKGIYLCSLDTGTGILGPCTLAAAAKNPNFLTLSPDHQYLFAALAKTVGSFKLRADGKLIALNAQPSGGTVPCHVSVDATGRHLFVANYDGGNIAGFNVGADGLIGERTALKKFSGSGPNVSRQNKPYAHSIYVSPENTWSIAATLARITCAFSGSILPTAVSRPPARQQQKFRRAVVRAILFFIPAASLSMSPMKWATASRSSRVTQAAVH